MGKKLAILTLALVVAGSAANAAELAHRWSFNGDLKDSVGGRDAVIVDLGASNVTLSQTQATLAGGAKDTSDYIDLPDRILSSLGDSATIEVWTTQNAIQNWSRIWDFGSSTAHNVFMSWTVGTTLTNDRVEWLGSSGNVTQDGTNAPYTLGTEFHIVFVFQPGSISWYSAPAGAADLGPAQGTLQTTNLLSSLQDTNAWIGRSQWPDNTASASFNEFRLWKGVLTETEREKLHDQGPDTIDASIASKPFPANRAVDVSRDIDLSWVAGENATAHNVYLGTSFAEVGAAATNSPLAVAVGQDANSLDPGRLVFGQTYYWRVDEVVGGSVAKGNVWSFSVEPYSYPITGVTATASSAAVNMGPQKTVDGSGLTPNDEHSTVAFDGWMTAKGDATPWIQFAFDGVRKLDKALVWNSNQALESILGFGVKDATVEYSTDDEAWTQLGDFQLAQATSSADYLPNTTIDFGGAAVKFVKLTINGNWGGVLPQYGLSEVRFYYVPVVAREPKPAAGATAVHPQVPFSWRAGREAASHKVFVGEDQQAVIDGAVALATVSVPQYDASLMLDKTYFWKVVEVNNAEAVSEWAGPVWSFSTANFIAVDDFEAYTDKEGGRIYESWIDGFDVAANGSLVGYDIAPFAEQTILHGGKQSMPLFYENKGGATYSEAKLTFPTAQDWTQHGIKTLVLFFRGQATNSPAPVYLKINDTKISYNNGAAATALPLWKQWNIPLTTAGVNFKSVKSLTIGVEGTGTGTLFVDDIRLYATAPDVVGATDPGATGLVALYTMDDNVQDSSGKNYHGTLNAAAGYEAGYLGKALGFNGSSTYVDLPIGPLMPTLNSMTIATHVNFKGGSGEWQRILDFGTGTTNYMFLTPRQGAAGSMRFAIRTAAVGEQIVDAPAAMPLGWHHAAITIDSATMTMKLYLDGELVGTAATTLLPKDLGNTNQNWLGRSQYTADAYFSGLLDEFRIYNRALSAAEVRYLAGDR
ncbi:MAG TPA: LamG-like jellyroll fold domain-containing protein [Sedimentisphaerales bacterium]|nr:LamG-like jellyroll fold domain-containing protein [Sedimentisphaerales bacterium]